MTSAQYRTQIKLQVFRWLNSLILCIFVFWLPSQINAQGIMQEVAEAVHKYHISQPPVATVLAVSIEGLNEFLQTLDPHSKYLTAEAYLKIKQIEKEGYNGIGAEVARNKHGIVLIPFYGGPVYRSGIRERQYLMAINGHKTEGMDLNEVGRLLAGPQGSTVTLGVSPYQGSAYQDVMLFRERFTPPSVEVITESKLEYLRIRHFTSHRTVPSLTVAIKRMKAKGLPVILDLRDSTGGDLHEALDAVSLFLPGGKPIGKVTGNSGNEQFFYSLPDQQLLSDRILVLVGPTTASAAELFLAGLKHYSRAVVIGQRTYGKCTSQKYIELSDGSAVKLTNLRIFYPSGEFCNGAGLIPDILVTDRELFQTTRLISEGIKELQLSIRK